jgi:6-pyruvoyltetrahydropterin/6-carboxytetrahydropterin synthase
MGKMWELEMAVPVSAAHYLPHYEGACANLHGHNWKIGVILSCSELQGDKQDFVLDFKQVKAVINDSFDHRLINDAVKNPTAENIARYVADRLTETGMERVRVDMVSVEETDGNFIRFYPEGSRFETQ